MPNPPKETVSSLWNPALPGQSSSNIEQRQQLTVVLEEARNLRHPELVGPREAFAEVNVEVFPEVQSVDRLYETGIPHAQTAER